MLVALGTNRTPIGALQKAHGLDRLPVANGGREVAVYTTGAPYLTGHADTDPDMLPGITRTLGVQSLAATPVHVAGERRGILVVCSATPEFFSTEDLR